VSFQRRLFLAFTLFLVVVLTISFAGVYIITYAGYLREVNEVLAAESRAQLFEMGAVYKTNARSPVALLSSVYDDNHRAILLSKTAEVRASDTRLPCLPPEAMLQTVIASGETFDFACRSERFRGVAKQSALIGDNVLITIAPLAPLEQNAQAMIRTMLLVAVIAIALAALLARTLVRGLTRGIDSIRRTTQEITRGNLGARVKLQDGDTDIQSLARDIDEMNERLQELVTSQERFVAHAAHELRSPVTALYGELSLALRKDRSKESYRETIELATESAARLKDLSEELLTLVRGAKEEAPAFAPVDLTQLCSSVWVNVASSERAQALAHDTPAKLEPSYEITQTDDGAFWVQGNQSQLERLLRNLLENAHRHADARENQPGRVQITFDRANRLLRVFNSGEAIPASDRERLFDPFFRGARSRANHRGAGLGLAIARNIAIRHQATLSVNAEIKDGSAFDLVFAEQAMADIKTTDSGGARVE
jgi:two-component system, OmpR family, sensor kinase